jgi:ribosomal protein S12 methylthiotransferase accessory factor YcaO
LQRLGFRVVIKDLSRGLAPVILVFAQDARRGITSVATHCDFDPGLALEHALSELESTVFLRLRSSERRRIAPAEVRMPLDHGALYAQKAHFRRADHLASAGRECKLRSAGAGACRRWQQLVEEIDARGERVLSVDLTPEGARLTGDTRTLRVVRAVVTGLLPVTFGYGCEPLGLLPASSTKTPLFPHPFA